MILGFSARFPLPGRTANDDRRNPIRGTPSHRRAPNTCVTLEVQGDADRWVQVLDKSINVAYPFAEEPLAMLKAPQVTKIVCWEAHLFATFEFAELEEQSAADWIDAYFVECLGCPPGDYRLEIYSQQL